MIIALTGKLGSGKTTVSEMFVEMGANVINADKIGHQLLMKQSIKQKLIDVFGNEILEGKSISRRKLAENVFHNVDNLKRLNKLIHPVLIQKIKEKIKPDITLNVIDAALYYELDLKKISDRTLLIKCSEDKALKRINNIKLISRRGFQKEIKNPDYVVDNNRSLEETKEQVLRIWGELVASSLSRNI